MSKSFRRSNDDWDDDIVDKEYRLRDRKAKRSEKLNGRDPEKEENEE